MMMASLWIAHGGAATSPLPPRRKVWRADPISHPSSEGMGSESLHVDPLELLDLG
jgi:hypothetical protein